jgi:hypothetical protein
MVDEKKEESTEENQDMEGEDIESAYNAILALASLRDIAILGKPYPEKVKTIQRESVDIIRKSISNIHERLFKEKQ